MSSIIRCAVSLTLMLTAASAWAHHSTAAFDLSKTVALDGTLTKVDWRNPHIELSVDVTNDRGRAITWVIESASPNFFRGRNVDKNKFQRAVGQTVILEVYGAKDGSSTASMLKIVFSDGTSVSGAPGY